MSVLVVLVALVCVPVWPGIFTIDSQAILRSARGGAISNWYSPLHGWVWAGLDALGLPPGGFFVLGVTALATSVLILSREFVGRRPARVVTAVVVLWPPVYGLLGWVGRDVWFASEVVAITALAWRAHRARWVVPTWELVTLVFLGIAAADARQNGLPFALLASGIVAVSLTVHSGRRSRRAHVFAVTCAAAALSAGVVMAQGAVITERYHPAQIVYARDLVAVSLDVGDPLLDETLFPSQDVSGLRDLLDGRDPEAAIALNPPVLRFDPYHDDDVSQSYAAQWRRMVVRHPLAYARSRGALYLDQLGLFRPVRSPFFGRSDDLGGDDDLRQALPALADARLALLSWTAILADGETPRGTILHAPFLYGLGSLVAAFPLTARGRQRRAAAVFVAVLAAMQALLFISTPTSEYRFQFFQVVLGATVVTLTVARACTGRTTSRSVPSRSACTRSVRH